jgi:hypothetical protein
MSSPGWATEPKKSLTAQEVLMVAYAHLICGVDQAVLSSVFGGINPGRINEAITVVRDACEHHREHHAQRTQLARASKEEKS